MASRLVGAKPLSESMLEYCEWYPKEQTSVKLLSKFTHLYSWKCIWKCRLESGGHTDSAQMCWLSPPYTLCLFLYVMKFTVIVDCVMSCHVICDMMYVMWCDVMMWCDDVMMWCGMVWCAAHGCLRYVNTNWPVSGPVALFPVHLSHWDTSRGTIQTIIPMG